MLRLELLHILQVVIVSKKKKGRCALNCFSILLSLFEFYLHFVNNYWTIIEFCPEYHNEINEKVKRVFRISRVNLF